MADAFTTRALRTSLLLPLAAAAALSAAGAANATALVVRSSGPSAPSYKPGKALPDNARVALRPGDMLTVLATDSTRTFRGPGTFALAGGGGGGNPAALAGRRGRFSALRTAGIIPRSPTLWHIDVAQNGRMCLADRHNVMLWRANATRAATLTINQGSSKQSAQWPAGQATLAWPTAVPIVAGAEYQLSLADAAPSRITFATLATMPTDLTSVATALIEQKCDNQLELLIQTVPEANPNGS
ncbi:MAG: hypothetical protein JWN69_14 [Alphaproteobacteria bacterium]|nr:hypothetical protein [Alphaproteobacteria bacterium]